MYKAFYGLHDKPFSQTLDLKYLYSGRSHAEALAFLSTAIKQKNSHYIVLTGDIGSGKTMLLRSFINGLGRNNSVIQVSYPAKTGPQLLQIILHGAGIESTGEDMDLLRKKLTGRLITLRQENKKTILVIDEAQNLGEDAFREVYRLSMLMDGEENLLRIIFSGLPKMLKKINSLKHSGLPAQVDIFHLENLSPEEVGEYIRHRLFAAGRPDATVFPQEVIGEISHLSHGVPRIINTVCDALLAQGYFAHEKMITQSTLNEVTNKLFFLDAEDDARAGEEIKGKQASADKAKPAPLDNNVKEQDPCDVSTTVEYKLSLTIFILEKNARMKVHLENELHKHGYTFVTVQRAEELFDALKRSPAEQLQIIVADAAFFFTETGDEDPEGKGVLDRIQARYAYVPVIMTSTLPLTGIRTKLFRRGIPFLLNKPDMGSIDMSEVGSQFSQFFHTLQNCLANIHCQLSQFYNLILKWNPRNTD